MKRYIIMFCAILSSTALAVDNTQTCTGNSCAVKLVPKSSGGANVTALTAAGTGALTLGPTSGGGDLTQTITSGAQTTLSVLSTGTNINAKIQIDATGTGIPYLQFNKAGSTKWELGSDNSLFGTNGLYLVAGATTVFGATSAGTFTFGPTGTSGARPINIFNSYGASGDSAVRLNTAAVLAGGEAASFEVRNNGAFMAKIGAEKLNGGTSTQTCGILQLGEDATPTTTRFLWVDTSGNLEIGTEGNVCSTGGTVVGTQTSDARLKENVKDSVYGLSAVLALKPKQFNKKVSPNKPEVGFLAQDVIKVVPEAVKVTDMTDESGVDHVMVMEYVQLVPVLTKAVQELKSKNDALEARLAALEAGGG